MRVQVMQHVPFEGLGSIGPWLEQQGFAVSWTRFFQGDACPAVDAFDWLIVLGGPMSVHDEQQYPWLAAEQRCIRTALESGRRVLGICLGAQLMARALGARVYPGPEKEIGWLPVHAVGQTASGFGFADEFEAFHWHGETFDLPLGAVHLARSRFCMHQAFSVGEHALGLQFHLETTPASAQAIIAHCADELVDGPAIASAAQLKAVDANRYAALNAEMVRVLEYLAAT